MEGRNLKLFLALETISALALGSIIPAYVVYFREYGVTLFELAVLAAVFEATIMLFELPTGKFADRYGRKKSVAIGFFMMVLAGALFLSLKGFYGFLVAEIFFGLAEAFLSGALEALAVDSINEEARERRLPGLFGNRTIARNGGLLAGMVGGGYLAGLMLSWLFMPLVILGGAAFLVSFFLIEPSRKSIRIEPATVSSGRLRRAVFGNRMVLALFAVGLLANFAFEPIDQYWQVMFDEIRGVDIYWFGWLTGAGLVLSGILARLTVAYYRRPGIYLTVMFLSAAAGLGMAAELSLFPALAGIILFFTVKSLLQPVVSTNLNIQFKAENRAEFLSGYNLTCSIGEVAAGLTAGTVVTAIGVGNLFLAAAVAAVLIPVVYNILSGYRRA